MSERANGRASGPVLQSVFLAVFDHSALPFLDKNQDDEVVEQGDWEDEEEDEKGDDVDIDGARLSYCSHYLLTKLLHFLRFYTPSDRYSLLIVIFASKMRWKFSLEIDSSFTYCSYFH